MDRDDIIVQLTNIGWQEEDIIKVQIFIFCFHSVLLLLYYSYYTLLLRFHILHINEASEI